MSAEKESSAENTSPGSDEQPDRRQFIKGASCAIGAAIGAVIFGMVLIGLTYTTIDQDWYLVFLGGMLLIAVLFNNAIRKRVTGER